MSHVSRHIARLSAALAVAALIAPGAGWAASTEGTGNADPARIAPQSTLVYLVADLQPPPQQQAAATELGRKLLASADPAQRTRELIAQALRDAFGAPAASFEEHVEPWLGRRVAVAVPREAASATALIVAATDSEKARKAVERLAAVSTHPLAARSHNGVDYLLDPTAGKAVGVVAEYVVVADEPALRAVVGAAHGTGLSAKPEYQRVAGQAEGRLAFGYIDSGGTATSTDVFGNLPAFVLRGVRAVARSAPQPLTLTLTAQPDRLVLETVQRGVRSIPGATGPGRLVPGLPGDSWYAQGAPQVGRTLVLTGKLGGPEEASVFSLGEELRARTGLDLERDVAPALGDVAFFLRGSTPSAFGAGVVVQTPDSAAARRLLVRVRPIVAREGRDSGLGVSSASIGGAEGFRVTGPELPKAIYAVMRGSRMVVAYGDASTRAALSPAKRLADSADYRAARRSLGGRQPETFVAFGPIARLVGTSADPDAQKLRAHLSALHTLATETTIAGGTQTTRSVLTVR
jgi:hypothetical protein